MIPLTKPFLGKDEIKNAVLAIKSGHIESDGVFSQKVTDFLKKYLTVKFAFLTPSASSALELSLRALKLPDKSEVILPSFTMSSTANAVLACNLIPKFCDIEDKDFSLDPKKVEKMINRKTKVIMTVHYGGRIGPIEELRKISKKHDLYLIEDAAAALGSFKNNKSAGTFGDIGVFSFHSTKNIIGGEGGVLVTNDKLIAERIEVIRQHGTNRNQVMRGVASSYVWQDLGGSFLLSDVLASIIFAQLKKITRITRKRIQIAVKYNKNFEKIGGNMILPGETKYTNWHTFYFLVKKNRRDEIINKLRSRGVGAAFHYLPLHDSPMGRKMGYKKGDLPVTENIAYSLIRLPIYYALSNKDQKFIIDETINAVADNN